MLPHPVLEDVRRLRGHELKKRAVVVETPTDKREFSQMATANRTREGGGLFLGNDGALKLLHSFTTRVLQS